MTKYPKISIVTVNFNGERYLEETINSVLNQKYPNLEYIIIDGGSTDGSIDIIKKYEHKLAYWVSEKDEGQYYAVQKGFEKSTGDIMAWINSDDLYVPNAFFAVAEIFNEFADVDWLMGVPREYNKNGVMMSRISLPWGRWSKHRYYTYDFQFIQQESSFWKRDLWETTGGKMNTAYKQAGDMELWARFFRYAKLHTTTATLAGFRNHSPQQRSMTYRQQYLMECQQVISNELAKFSPLKRAGYFILKFISLFWGIFFFYDIPILNLVFPLIYGIPRVIHYDFSANKFVRKNLMVKLPPLFAFRRQVHKQMFRKK